jgi:hypothetical protein
VVVHVWFFSMYKAILKQKFDCLKKTIMCLKWKKLCLLVPRVQKCPTSPYFLSFLSNVHLSLRWRKITINGLISHKNDHCVSKKNWKKTYKMFVLNGKTAQITRFLLNFLPEMKNETTQLIECTFLKMLKIIAL